MNFKEWPIWIRYGLYSAAILTILSFTLDNLISHTGWVWPSALLIN